MKRVLLGAVGFVLFLMLAASPANAAVMSEANPSTFRVTGEATRKLSPDQSPIQLSAAQGESGPVAAATMSAAGLNGILSEGFESPEPVFSVYGPGWALTDHRKAEGSYSAYCAGMFVAPPGPYEPNMESLLIAGPFDLSMYTSAQVSFDAWAEQAGGDVLFAGVSADGYNFDGLNYTGSTNGAWSSQTLDISEYRGSPEVWVMFAFSTDATDEYEGVYLDRISLAGAPVPALNPIFRFYNFTNGTHFYTPSVEERDGVIAKLSNVYSYDGVAYYTSVYNNRQPLYRFYNRQSGGHFYTASAEEADAVRAKWPNIFMYEGTTYSVNPAPVPNSVPVFRFYNKKNGTHFYTASAEERDMVMARWPNVYGYEGPAFWVGQQTLPTHETAVAPSYPIGETLWQPSGATLPATGNYIYLDSENGDYVGAGQEYLYTHDNASILVEESGGHLRVRVGGNDWWSGDFQIPSDASQYLVGYYPGLTRYPIHDPAFGGMKWSGEGRGGTSLTGWFFVDSATYENGHLAAIDMRFEQHADGATPALNGKIHWRAADVPPPPVLPDSGWQPGMPLPTSGTFVHLKGDPGEYVLLGKEYLYTPQDAAVSITEENGHLAVAINGDQWWNGNFKVPGGSTEFQVGDYLNVAKFTYTTIAQPCMQWSGEGRANAWITGWFSVDSVTYVDGELTAIEMRFEQRSTATSPALHGEIHWSASDTQVPPGPVNPIPAELWKPLGTRLPSAGNYVYLDSDLRDYIGGGQEYLYTPAESPIVVGVTGTELSVQVDGWRGRFIPMNSIGQLQVGYYPDLQRAAFSNPAKGGLSWSGKGRGSNELTGWFAIDSVTYTDGQLTAIDLRFEQHNEGGPSALHGAIHWRADGS